MATNRRRNTTPYSTYGSVAYAPTYDGSAVRAPRREEELYRALMDSAGSDRVTSYAQLTMANDEMVSLRRQLFELKVENTTLSAQYEKVFDLATIQEAVGDTMVKPTGEQVVYIDLSAPDTVTVYEGSSALSGLSGLVEGIKGLFGGIIEYFR